ncbi:MAG: tetratricopeptide repeat protein [Tepidisphaeraceae bacterium]
MKIDTRLREGFAHFQAGRLPQAEAICREVLAADANRPEAWQLYGLVAHRAGQLPFAVEALRKAASLRPDVAEFHFALANALRVSGQLDLAIASYHAALRLRPDFAEAHLNAGIAFANSGRREEAAKVWEDLIKLRPRDADAIANLANLYRSMGRLGEAIDLGLRSLAIAPDRSRTISNLAVCYEQQGRLDEAIACYRKAIALDPRAMFANSNLLMHLQYHDNADPAAVFAEHRQWNEKFAAPLASEIRPHQNDRSPDRRLRIGYVSPDFREHAVSFFIEPILEHHDASQVEVFCYANMPNLDAVTRRLQSHGHTWRNAVGMRDPDLGELVRSDRIDILVDLSVHTGAHRLLLFARKPAPVQVTYLGYAGTTGMDAIDWRITDAFVDPIGLSESLHSEKLMRLPRTQWCYQAPADAPPFNVPPVAPPPFDRQGFVTFGSAPNLAKITATAMDAWAEVLRQIAGSRLALKARGLSDESTRRRFFEAFSARGIEPSRLTLEGAGDLANYLRFFAGLDICLDTFPFAGGTTTCHTLYMGVPVVTRVGATSVSRVGASVLTNVGLSDLITQTPETFVATAVALADDVVRLRELRRNLRERMRASPLCDAPGFVRDLEAAYRQMWQTWCRLPQK